MSLLSTPKLVPCNCWSPHEAGMERKGRQEKPVPLQCNRPRDHEGNHMVMTRNFECLAEWGQAKVVK